MKQVSWMGWSLPLGVLKAASKNTFFDAAGMNRMYHMNRSSPKESSKWLGQLRGKSENEK